MTLLVLALASALVYLGYLTAWAAVLYGALKATVAVASLLLLYVLWRTVRRSF
jgi:hypothetical protein